MFSDTKPVKIFALFARKAQYIKGFYRLGAKMDVCFSFCRMTMLKLIYTMG